MEKAKPKDQRINNLKRLIEKTKETLRKLDSSKEEELPMEGRKESKALKKIQKSPEFRSEAVKEVTPNNSTSGKFSK